MKEFIRKIVLLTVTLVLVGIGVSCQNSFSGDGGGEESSPSLQAPVVTPASGQFSEGFKTIEIENKNNMGDIFYTVDGSNPSRESFRYTGPFKIYGSSVVKAVVIYKQVCLTGGFFKIRTERWKDTDPAWYNQRKNRPFK